MISFGPSAAAWGLALAGWIACKSIADTSSNSLDTYVYTY